MAVTIYKSTDGSAPVLTGAAGTLTAVLDACLVNGYGSKTAAGWTKSYVSGGGAWGVYRMGGGNQFYLNIDDAGNTTGGTKEANARGFETKSATDTYSAQTNGTGPFPTTTQLANGVVIRKTATADTTARAWMVIADDRTVYLLTNTGDFTAYSGFMFGDIYSLLSGDGYRTFIAGRDAQNSPGSTPEHAFSVFGLMNAALPGNYLPRAYTGTGGSITANKTTDWTKCQNNLAPNTEYALGAAGILPYPNGPDGGLYLTPILISESSTIQLRGRLRGIYGVCHLASNFSDGDTFSGTSGTDYAGKSFMIVKNVYGPSSTGFLAIETSNTWDTSS